MQPKNVPLRINTNGANDAQVSSPGGANSQEAFDAVAFILNGGASLMATGWELPPPSTPIVVTFGQVYEIAEHVQDRNMHVSILNIKLEEEKSKNRLQALATNSNETLGGNGSSSPYRVNNAKIAVGLMPSTLTAIRGSADGLPRRPDFSGVPSTPTKSQTTYSPGRVAPGAGTGGSPRTHHKRNHTPTQNTIRSMMGGKPVYTVGIEPQEYRTLLADFFNDICKWAKEWTTQVFSPEQVADFIQSDFVVAVFVRNTVDTDALLGDDAMRAELVAGIVSQDIVSSTLCDTFLFKSGLPEVQDLVRIFRAYAVLHDNQNTAKHELLLEQKRVYKRILATTDYKKWRLQLAKELAEDLVRKLGGLIGEQTGFKNSSDRKHGLEDLYLRGIRIAFRMRQEAVKWQMNWAISDENYDGNAMVYVSHDLHGSSEQTMHRVFQAPGNYAVRFSKSPTITKTEYSTGDEHTDVVHKGMVHLVRKATYIGAERVYASPSSARVDVSPSSARVVASPSSARVNVSPSSARVVDGSPTKGPTCPF